MAFQSIDPSLFNGRPDPIDDRRVGEDVREQNYAEAQWVLGGYPDDEGVRLNHGRPGANEGPDVIRKFLYKMTASPFIEPPEKISLFDAGNLRLGDSLAQRHEAAKAKALETFQANKRWIALGGGHDYGYGDASAFLEWCAASDQRGLVLNFDAHLDVREYDQTFHSGTPFRRLLDRHPDFDFFEIGIQAQTNSRAHVQWAKSRGTHVITWDELELAGTEGPGALVLRRLEGFLTKRRPVFLSVDLDAFALPLSLGTSAPSVLGFTAPDFFPLWEVLRARLDVRGAGFYEHAPTYDPQNCTARLAALLIHRLVACESPAAATSKP